MASDWGLVSWLGFITLVVLLVVVAFWNIWVFLVLLGLWIAGSVAFRKKLQGVV